MSGKVIDFTMADASRPEGYTGEKISFVVDPWKDIFASIQSKGKKLKFLAATVTALETHTIKGESFHCAVVMLGHVKGLIPLQESDCKTKEQLRKLMGQRVSFKVTTLNQKDNLFIASRKIAREHMAKQNWEKLKEGDIKTATIRDVNLRGATVDIGGILAELPAQELSWGWVNDVRDYLKVGFETDVKIIALDKEKGVAKVSIRELLPNPWPDCTKRFSVGNEYLGTVTGIQDYGIFVNLNEPGVDALAKQRTEGLRPALYEKVIVKIQKILPKEQRIKCVITAKLGIK